MSMQKLNLTNKYVIDWEQDRIEKLGNIRAKEKFIEMQQQGRINKTYTLVLHDATEKRDPTFFAYDKHDGNVISSIILKPNNHKNIDAQLDNKGFNTKFSTFTTEAPFQQKIKYLAMEYCKNAQGFMFLASGTGTGKTHIAKATLRTLAKQGMTYGYLNWNDWMTNLKANFNSLREEIDKYVNQEILVIDDLFSSSNLKFLTAFEENATNELIRKRAEKNLLTIITSTKSLQDIIKINEKIGSIIFEQSTNNNLHIKLSESYNYRLRKGK